MRRLIRGVAVVVGLLCGAAVAAQDLINPTTLEFTASADHASVTRYEVRWYAQGASAPVQRTDLGKPTPDGASRVVLSMAGAIMALPIGGPYVARVAAINAQGEGVSDPSNPFSRALSAPAPPSGVRISR